MFHVIFCQALVNNTGEELRQQKMKKCGKGGVGVENIILNVTYCNIFLQ